MMKKLVVVFLCLFSFAAYTFASAPRVFFMDPVESPKDKTPVFRLITDETKLNEYKQWLANDAAKWALDLYSRAWKIAAFQPDEPVYYVALVPDGNHADLGFTLLNGTAEQALPKMVYIKLDPDAASFKTLMLHETGHMILMLLNGGQKLPQEQVASIPHTTAALTDRITAFDEGFAIHLETLAVHFLKDPEIQARYNHQNFQFGVPLMLGEYHRIAGDLLSYSQSTTRYADVRDNAFAFAAADRTGNYFRSQMEKSRDYSELRDANQLLQSEGFHATFFFSQLVRGKHPEYDRELSTRQDKMLTILRGVLHDHSNTKPYLLRFIEQYLKEDPEEGAQIVDVLLDLSHGVFVDPKAQRLWHDHYLKALSMDLAEKSNGAIETSRQNWKKQVLANPTVLYSLLGPEIPVQIKGTSILLVAFEEPAPLAFDVNTAPEGVIRCIPGIKEEELTKWIAERHTRPFSDANDFKTRSGLSAATLNNFEFVSPLVK